MNHFDGNANGDSMSNLIRFTSIDDSKRRKIIIAGALKRKFDLFFSGANSVPYFFHFGTPRTTFLFCFRSLFLKFQLLHVIGVGKFHRLNFFCLGSRLLSRK